MNLIALASGQLSITSTAVKLPGAPVNASYTLSGPTMVLHVKSPGEDGNDWKIYLQDPAVINATLSHEVDLTNRLLRISLATSGLGAITTTGQQLADYMSSGAGTELNKWFSYTLSGSVSTVITVTSSWEAFSGGQDGKHIFLKQQPTQLLLSVSGNAVRYRVDGGTPTASVGMRGAVNTDVISFSLPGGCYADLIENMKIISESGTAVVDYTLFREI